MSTIQELQAIIQALKEKQAELAWSDCSEYSRHCIASDIRQLHLSLQNAVQELLRELAKQDKAA